MRAMAQTDVQAKILAEALAQAQAAQAEAVADAEQMRRTSLGGASGAGVGAGMGAAEAESELLELMGVKRTTGEDEGGEVTDDAAVGGPEPDSPESSSAC